MGGRRTTTLLRPKKSLGQNFLRDANIARKIVAAFNPRAGEVIVEIGPGEGALTSLLLAEGSRLVLIELDDRAAAALVERFAPSAVEVRHEDVLRTDLPALAARYGAALRVIGNIPYYITTPILFQILDHRSSVRDALLMMQKDVARRLVAGPGTKEYGILSVFCSLLTDARLLFDVPPGVFHPRPRVVSSVVHLTMLKEPRYALHNEEEFRSMVRSVFGKRRKTLRNSLKYFLGDDTPLPEGWDLQRRPEDLTVEELAGLSNALSGAREQSRSQVSR